MIDCTDRERLVESGNELFEMLMDNRLKEVPLLIFANKQDLPNAMTSSEVAEAIGLVRLEERTWQIKACSAVEGSGIKVSKHKNYKAFRNILLSSSRADIRIMELFVLQSLP